MTAKEYLRQAYRLNELVHSHLAEIESLRTLAYRVAGSNISDYRGGTRQQDAPFAQCVMKIVDAENALSAEISRLMELKSEMNDAINAVTDPSERMLLRYRYLHNHSWEEIGSLMCVANSTAHRIHASAIGHFSVPT